MFRKSILNISLSDSEDPRVDQQLSESVSLINISLSSLDESVDKLLNPLNDMIRSGSVIESKIHAGIIKRKNISNFHQIDLLNLFRARRGENQCQKDRKSFFKAPAILQ